MLVAVLYARQTWPSGDHCSSLEEMLEIIIPNYNAKVYWYHLKDLPMVTHEAAAAAAEMYSVKYCEGNLGRKVCILSHDKRQRIYGGVRRNVACLI